MRWQVFQAQARIEKLEQTQEVPDVAAATANMTPSEREAFLEAHAQVCASAKPYRFLLA